MQNIDKNMRRLLHAHAENKHIHVIITNPGYLCVDLYAQNNCMITQTRQIAVAKESAYDRHAEIYVHNNQDLNLTILSGPNRHNVRAHTHTHGQLTGYRVHLGQRTAQIAYRFELEA